MILSPRVFLTQQVSRRGEACHVVQLLRNGAFSPEVSCSSGVGRSLLAQLVQTAVQRNSIGTPGSLNGNLHEWCGRQGKISVIRCHDGAFRSTNVCPCAGRKSPQGPG